MIVIEVTKILAKEFMELITGPKKERSHWKFEELNLKEEKYFENAF